MVSFDSRKIILASDNILLKLCSVDHQHIGLPLNFQGKTNLIRLINCLHPVVPFSVEFPTYYFGALLKSWTCPLLAHSVSLSVNKYVN